MATPDISASPLSPADESREAREIQFNELAQYKARNLYLEARNEAFEESMRKEVEALREELRLRARVNTSLRAEQITLSARVKGLEKQLRDARGES